MPRKKELLRSPVRRWDDSEKEYDAVLFVPAGTKHDSGYMHIAIIGVTSGVEGDTYEICGWPDDVSTHFPEIDIGLRDKISLVRMDCYYPSGVFRYHSGGGKFKVSDALSSQDIYFIKK